MAQLRQFASVNIDCHFGIGAGKRGGNAVRERIADHRGRSRNTFDRILNFCAQLALVFFQIHAHEDFRGGNGLGVFVIFGATGALGDADDTVDFFHFFRALAGDALGFVERSSRHGVDEDRVAIFVKRREKTRAEGARQPQRTRRKHERSRDHAFCAAQAEIQNRHVEATDLAHGKTFLRGRACFVCGGNGLCAFLFAESERAKHGNNRYRNDERHRKREHERNAERAEKLTFQAGKEKHRREHEQNNHRRVADGAENFVFCAHEHVEFRTAFFRRERGVF